MTTTNLVRLLALLCAIAPALRADEKKPSPGWHVAYASLDKDGGSDTRADRLAALYVPAGKSATPLLKPGPFRATFTGTLPLELKGDFTFSAVGSGKLVVSVDGKECFSGDGDLSKVKSRLVALKRGGNVIVATYNSPAKGDAVFRLEWASDEFRREPLDPRQITHADDKALSFGRKMRQGRELIAGLHCLKCHSSDAAAWVKGGAMPELEADAPSLADVGARLNATWVARWLMDPHALRPAATMPRVFADLPRGDKAKIDPRLLDAAAYLGSLGKAEAKAPVAKKEEIESGTRLFATLGCIGCHLAPDRDDWRDDEHRRLPLRDVVSKWKPAALVAFLRQPDKHYAWVRMPNFALSEAEASNLAAYLRNVKPRDVFPSDLKGADVAKGKKLVESSGCLSCHRVTDAAPKPHAAAPAFDKLTKDALSRGCLSDKASKAPAWHLDAAQKAALTLTLTDGRESLKRDTADEFLRRQRDALRCVSCHKIDNADDRWTQLKDENDGLTADLAPPDAEAESKFPAVQVRPPLTWAGEKLRPEWAAKLFAGKLTEKPRPYLKARMPAFPRRAEMLAAGLSAEHGFAPSSAATEPDAKAAEMGRTLSGKTKWNCASCHVVGKAEAVGVFEAPGPNFADIKDRLRREYFDRWLWSPTRVEPGTKMPTVYNWGKKSLLDELDGDAGRQIDALWAYLQTGKKIKAPPAE